MIFFRVENTFFCHPISCIPTPSYYNELEFLQVFLLQFCKYKLCVCDSVIHIAIYSTEYDIKSLVIFSAR